MKKLLLILTGFALLLASCSKPEDPLPPEPDPQDEPTPEPEPEIPEVPEGKPRYVWIDAAANFVYYANDKAYIAKEVTKIADCGFTDIIVDVRPTEGTVLWKS